MKWLYWLMVPAVLGVTVTLTVLVLRESRRTSQTGKSGQKEWEQLQALRAVTLTQPLSEKLRPDTLEDIVGQEEAVAALKAALCGTNPQHILLYGPPGVGKTCAARAVLEFAKTRPGTPFRGEAPFVELDAACVRFDERAIADPLMGSVHDPIYQGSGSLGARGVPQPKPGAVTRAHGGVLFLDEIGELHPVQMNRLLKVLEDRRVMPESSYYDREDENIPLHIRDAFENGLPADFRLIGATTRRPEELPEALRSRCVEIFFRTLKPEQVSRIACEAARRAGFDFSDTCGELVGRYADSGRGAVNIVQLAGGLAELEGRREILRRDVEWVLETGRHSPRVLRRVPKSGQVGVACGLAVTAGGEGCILEIQAAARPGSGRLTAGGIVEEEEMQRGGHALRRRSTAVSALENAVHVVGAWLGKDMSGWDIRVNFPGGMPVDGPSAGAAMTVAVASAVTGTPIRSDVAITGEVDLCGRVCPVGGVPAKGEAAARAGASALVIPGENDQPALHALPLPVYPVDSIRRLWQLVTGAEGEAVPAAEGENPCNLTAVGCAKDAGRV